MAEATESTPDQSDPRTGRGRNPVPKPGYLPVNELLFDRQGAASPFGEDTEFPLPVESLPYSHPSASDEY
jgi:succinate dehydrogenase / fumarate reductase iron-sulfur subunit